MKDIGLLIKYINYIFRIIESIYSHKKYLNNNGCDKYEKI